MFDALARKHKAMFEVYLHNGVSIQVRQPAPRGTAANAVEKMKGISTFETGIGVIQTVKAIWSNDLLRPEAVVPGDVSEVVAALGGKGSIDVIIRCLLDDVLITPGDKQGRTIFDTARDVVYSGHTFQIKGSKRTGFPPLGPYIYWVGLREIPHER